MSPLQMSIRLILLLLAGCDNTVFKVGGGEGGGGETIPEGQEGWCAVQSVFSAKCLACHGSAALGGLDLEADPHAAIVGKPSASYDGWTLVVPGDPEASLLYLKVAGTQPEGTGDEMPPGSGGLDGASLAAIAAWITDGAPSTCDDPDTGTGGTTASDYHPEGFADPAAHGREAKYQDQECTSCHGADLKGNADGSIPSCDTCHTPAKPEQWRTDCTFCHGGGDNATGAPPVGLFEEVRFEPHTIHVEESAKKLALDCTACHVEPTDVLSEGHIFIGDDTPAIAEVDFGSLNPNAVWNNGTCSNLYCHGNGQGNNGTIVHTASERDCNDCHATNGEGMSGEHEEHIEEGATCASCHDDTANGSNTIQDKSLHVNGRVDMAFTEDITFNAANTTCTGNCHLDDENESHNNRSWFDD